MRTETTFAPTGACSSATSIPKARIESIDATRGVALFLILFSHCIQGFFSSRNLLGNSTADNFCMTFFNFFVIHKSMMLFALLFGLSFFFQIKKATTQNRPICGSFLSRLAWLAVFGYINSAFDRNDMLLPFAACGLALPLLQRLSSLWLLTVSALLLSHPPELLHAVFGFHDPFENFLKIHLLTAPCTQGTAWFDLTVWNCASRIPWIFSHLYLTQRIFDILGMFLLGYVLGRCRVFEQQSSRRLLHFVAILAGILLIGFALRHYAQWEESSFKLMQSYLDVLQTLFYAMFFTCLFRLHSLAWLSSPMAAIGKSTLSCYMSQGVILSFLMYGWGLGWAETMPVSQKALLAVVIFLVQMIFCLLWLKRWPLCPMEMFWRKLVAHSQRP